MTTTDLRLVLAAPERLGQDEPLVAVARLLNTGAGPVVTSSRLNLLEGDLSVLLSGPGRAAYRVSSPYPVDSGLRRVTLGPGEAVEGGVLLLAGAAREPLFPLAGAYTLVAEFSPVPAEMVTGEPVTVLREEPADAAGRARARLLADPEVVAGLTSASITTAGRDAVTAALAATPVGRLLAALAVGDLAGVRDAAAALADRAGSVTAAATAVSVLPAGLFPGDERLAAVTDTLAGRADGDGRAAALLAERPWRA